MQLITSFNLTNHILFELVPFSCSLLCKNLSAPVVSNNTMTLGDEILSPALR